MKDQVALLADIGFQNICMHNTILKRQCQSIESLFNPNTIPDWWQEVMRNHIYTATVTGYENPRFGYSGSSINIHMGAPYFESQSAILCQIPFCCILNVKALTVPFCETSRSSRQCCKTLFCYSSIPVFCSKFQINSADQNLI